VVFLCIFAGCKHDIASNQASSELRARMLPPGASATDPKTTQANGTIVAEWDIQTDLKPDGLEEWLSKALKPDFTKTSAAGDRIWFAKYDDGESKRLEIDSTPEADGRTIAHVRLTIAPD
jgi:hypothetical protein